MARGRCVDDTGGSHDRPRDEYERRLQARCAGAARAEYRQRLTGNTRVAIVLVSVALCYPILVLGRLAPHWLILPALLFIVISVLHDRVSRAYGILRTAQTISSEETMHLLSSVRMGVNLGLISDLEIPTVNQLFIHTQPAHLQKLAGVELDTSDRNIERAAYLRRLLNGERPRADHN